MTGIPLISIAIPNFNYARYLDQCLRSVVEQEGHDIEILVADNCSTDGSWRIIEALEDSRIRAWRHSKNIGLYPNWNFLLQEARGKYFKLLQSDDWLEPNFAQNARQLLTGVSDKDIIALLLGYRISSEKCSSTQIISDPDIPSSILPSAFCPGEDFDAALRSLGYSMPTINILNTELAKRVGGYQPENSMRADSILFSKLLAAEPFWPIVCCDIPVAVTRVHQTNDRRNYSRFSASLDEIIFLRELSSLANDQRERAQVQELISVAAGQALLSLPIDLVRRKSFQEFAAHFRQLHFERQLGSACVAIPKQAWRTLTGKGLFVRKQIR